ncbi:unnamed protein product [Adineta steineri]|uniref:Uncharacterized protein n=1 Tax=Adineta steineri TaxID=433720 RepID=A0A818UX44_9BILA|nr:unnamed protein product [Adineta steineri]CAF3702939.1 unnamed protein product [Adineta steineri]
MTIIKSNASFLYDTIDNSKTIFDCFYAYINDDGESYEHVSFRTNYLIPYCRRPLSIDPINKIQGYIENTDTFKNLRLQGITSENLRQWSLSIDIIEQYSIYLIKNDIEFDGFIFNNCSSLWFGSHCQYTFNLNMFIESFGDFVDSSFEARQYHIGENIVIHTCYPHLSGCYRGPEPMCLDWREICDGKIDCIGEKFGIDEEYCHELEINECNENEYRCHNGAQCIPLEFFRDSRLSKDCLDGTDEPEEYPPSWSTVPTHDSRRCIGSMRFACEEKTCRQLQEFSCGNGFCVKSNFGIDRISMSQHACNGIGRTAYYLQAICKSAKQYPDGCYLLLYCKLGFYNILQNDTYNIEDCLRADWSSINCTLEYLSFPLEPILHGYFQPIYSTQSLIISDNNKGWPLYICTDPRLCLYLPKPTIRINGSDCRLSPQPLHNNWRLSYNLEESTTICALTGNINKYKSKSSLFYCKKSDKYISKHRLIDGIQDCFNGEDESYNDSCSLNDTQRFNCTSETKCLSPVGIGLDQPHCKNEEDRYIGSPEIFVYARLCNRIPDTPIRPEDNENDETNCELWPCHTPYTRCDSTFQCANGIDELNCPNVNCNINEFKCEIFNLANDYYCIRQEYIYEKPLDCINHDFSDGIYRDRNISYSNNLTFNINKKYISWKEKTCLTKNDICGYSSTNDQQLICSIVDKENIIISPTLQINFHDNRTSCLMGKHASFGSDPYYFSTWNLGYFPPLINETSLSSQQSININPKKSLKINTSIESIVYCNRAIVIFEGKSYEKKCLCPPNYYGDRCQLQNQRISLTLQIRPIGSHENKHSVYDIFIYLIDEQNEIIHNYEKINYMTSKDCNTKYNRYLLYPNQPKNPNHTYSIRIDIYEKLTLFNHYASWNLSIPFPFLPVNRIATQLRIPSEKSQPLTNCSIQCGNHGQCFNYINTTKEFCLCNQGYSGRFCNITYNCSCSSDSICLNSSICLCPLNKFGSKCYLQYTTCRSNNNSCQNNGLCIPYNNHINHDDFICLCPEKFMGSHCEYQSNKININFKINSIPTLIFAHYFISHHDHNRRHELITKFKKIPLDQYSIELFSQIPFNLLFIEFEKNFYLTVVREKTIPSENIATNINQDYKCENINKLLNSTILNYTNLRRLKYYLLPCRENLKLKCFYDEQYICVCDKSRYSNCFDFDHNTSYDCQRNSYCGNNGKCFQDNRTCPSTLVCMCDKCYYGSKCQFSSMGFSTSLDVIFGYHIKPFISFTKQFKAVKITASITILMLIFSIINGVLSILTFKSETLLKVGCGIYLLTNSIVSILTITIFTIKYFQLIIFQMKSITNTSFIHFSCILTDVLLKILLSFGDWLYVCVAIERTLAATQGVYFNQSKSKSIAKYVIGTILLLISISYIHDPISRRTINDIDDEQRAWCILEYSTSLKKYDKFINIFHVLIPFIINILSAICITIQVFRIRVKTKKKSAYKKILYAQIKQNKHLLISSCILILLSIPRLIISFMSGCMDSIRNPWLYLIGYYISFIPPLLIIILFILPSKTYKQEFTSMIAKINFFSK